MNPSKPFFLRLDPEKALLAYLEDGPTAEAARKVGVTADIFRAWVTSPEGRRAIDTARTSLNDLLDRGLTRIIDQAAARVLKAIEEGDTVILKDGTKTLRPMFGKDAANILSIMFDRRQLLRKQPTSIRNETDDKLEELAEKLRYLGGLTPTAPTNGLDENDQLRLAHVGGDRLSGGVI